MVPIANLAAIRAANPRLDLWESAFGPGASPQPVLICLETESRNAQAHVRMFAPSLGVLEDPATGSAAGPVGAYLHRERALAQSGSSLAFAIEQGLEMGRPSWLEVEVQGDVADATATPSWSVRVAGSAVVVGRGQIELPK
jgi:trans-2,3-dihydro-3-hydroxyanthranilate isomerase